MRILVSLVVGAAAVAALAAPVPPEWIQVAVDFIGGDPSNACLEPAVTPSGRFVVYHSAADDLTAVTGNTNVDVFVRDLSAGVNDCASRTPIGAEGNGTSRYASISANGRWVVFESSSTDLQPEGDAGFDVFVADRRNIETSLVSVGFDGSPANDESYSYGSVLSSNGRFVAFRSYATNLVEGVDTHDYAQVYLRDLRKGTTTLVSRDRDDPLSGATGTCQNPSISPNGRFVVYSCNSANLVPGNSNGVMHVYVHDARRGTTARVSVTAEGVLGSGESSDPVVSNNGRWVAFYSYAANLALPDTPGDSDALLADRRTGAFVNMSASAGSGHSYTPAISASGKVVVFYSEKSDLVPMDGNGTGDVFRYDPASGVVTRLSVSAAGVEGNAYSYVVAPSLASNGKVLAIASDADNLATGPVDAGDQTDVFLIRLK